MAEVVDAQEESLVLLCGDLLQEVRRQVQDEREEMEGKPAQCEHNDQSHQHLGHLLGRSHCVGGCVVCVCVCVWCGVCVCVVVCLWCVYVCGVVCVWCVRVWCVCWAEAIV